MAARTAYHHGDLRRTLLDAALDLIAEQGVAAVSLRGLARRAGVSHAAPAHHFTDKAGLFTAIAVEGHHLLADAMTAGTAAGGGPGHGARGAGDGDGTDAPAAVLRELGVRYVRFALDHPAHFDVMFRLDLCRADDPGLAAARERSGALLNSAVPGGPHGPRRRGYVLAAWSVAHGFATLWREGSLARSVGDGTPENYFEEAADVLFAPADPPAAG
ncbi:TetR/AcrR family transcriptional regulator [Marinitenerispora sediminis]|uniref:TetR family transcriptional regulator n=1 Tax=Marinitenerispora sediminis TaxID=1931232 RepID=A0A368T8P7_9ACTN|nr:TetR/AcrR family transcriptional regulator [Marinitenerispora sediminis]RCV53517.1 TetR family transcriptional regulator [Marinitenerispora sediminis]RCV57674.1 TetR family transcriptional regulator [Marinitenerispora sediminis]RCV60770.1 TetR family transcriptional regulator [Marinitenerispora sediminis]